MADSDEPRARVNVSGIDAYAPAEMAARMEDYGIVKAALPLEKLVMLSLLAGAFIGFGAALFTVVMTDPALGLGVTRFIGGIAFSLGLVLVIVGGAELFTGNTLIVMAWADGRVKAVALLRNWAGSYLGNAVGGIGLAILVAWSGVMAQGPVRDTAIMIAETKMALPMAEAFFRGVLCNALVCLAVWLCFAARTVTDKIFAIVLPISAFVALGFEHSIANFYLIPIGLMIGANGGLIDMLANIVPVTFGNIVGGAGGVAIVYWIIYRR